GLSLESWMLSIVMLINRTGSMVLPFLGVYMIDKLHFTLSDSGLVLACFGIGSVVGSSLGGWLTDKFGEYSVQALSLFLSVPMFCRQASRVLTVHVSFSVVRRRRVWRRYPSAAALAITGDPRPSDFVGHLAHGSGVFRGIEKIFLPESGIQSAVIEYERGDRL